MEKGCRSTQTAERVMTRSLLRSLELRSPQPTKQDEDMASSPSWNSERPRTKLLLDSEEENKQTEATDCSESIAGMKLLKTIGKGGSAIVKLGINKRGKMVAVKMLQDDLDQKTEDHSRDEFKLMSELEHPHVLKLINSGLGTHKWPMGNRRVYYGVFEYAENGELFDLVDVSRGLNERIAKHYFG